MTQNAKGDTSTLLAELLAMRRPGWDLRDEIEYELARLAAAAQRDHGREADAQRIENSTKLKPPKGTYKTIV